MNEPSPVLIAACHAIFASTDPRYVPSILDYVEDYHHSYVHILQKYCQEWSYKNTEEMRPLMPPPIRVVQPSQDLWPQYWSQINAYVSQGPNGLLSALQLLQNIRAHDSCAEHQTLLQQYLMTTLLPTINAYFLPQLDADHHYVLSPALLSNALSVLQLMGFLHAVCPRESEYLLHLSELSAQIVEAVHRTSSDAAFVRTVEQEASKVAPISPAVSAVVQPCTVLPVSSQVSVQSSSQVPSRVSVQSSSRVSVQSSSQLPSRVSVQSSSRVSQSVPQPEAGVFPTLQRVDSVVLNDSTRTLEAMGMRRRDTGGGCWGVV